MKDSLIDNQLRLHKLEMVSDSIDDAVMPDGPVMYNFEITNMSEGDLNPSSAAAKKSDTSGKNNNSDNANNGASAPQTPNAPAKKVNDLEPVDIGG